MCSQHSRDPKSVTQQASKDRAREPSQVLQSPGARVRNKYLCFIPSVPMNKKRLLFPLSSALRRQISASWWSRRPSSTNRNFKNRALLIAAVPFLPPPSFPSGFESRFTFLSRLLFLYAMPSKHPLPDFVGHLVANGRFLLLELLGAGSYGKVYRAVDTTSLKRTEEHYAVKCIHRYKQGSRRDTPKERILRACQGVWTPQHHHLS